MVCHSHTMFEQTENTPRSSDFRISMIRSLGVQIFREYNVAQRAFTLWWLILFIFNC